MLNCKGNVHTKISPTQLVLFTYSGGLHVSAFIKPSSGHSLTFILVVYYNARAYLRQHSSTPLI
jgi:hypothetical protein